MNKPLIRYNRRVIFIRPSSLVLFLIPVFFTFHYYLVIIPVFISVLIVFLSIWSLKLNIIFNYTPDKNGDYIFFNDKIIRLEREDNQILFTYNYRRWLFSDGFAHKIKANIHRNIDEYKNLKPFDEKKYQKNCLRIEIPSYTQLIYEHFTAPFFVFQIFCGVLWCLDEYIYHSLFTLVMLFIFELGVVFSRRITMKHYRSMEQKETKVKKVVFLNSSNYTIKEVLSSSLIPGDVLLIDSLGKVLADFILLKGTCAVNEAMLTGESLPNYKEDVSEFNGIFERQKKHVLFSGTEIVKIEPVSKKSNLINESENAVEKEVFINAHENELKIYKMNQYQFSNDSLLVMVIETGFSTQQGKLIRKMMTSAPPDNTEAYLFLLFLLMFAVLSSIIVLYQSLKLQKSYYKMLLEIILILTNVVPPELPLELTIAVNSAVQKLLTLGVFCLEPFRIINAGKVEIACFDKTGTLTESNMKMSKYISNDINALKEIVLTCNSLILNDKNVIMGDSLEISSFNHFQGKIVSTNKVTCESQTYNILKKFYFSSALRRMSVIYQKQGVKDIFLGMKGAPETVKKYIKNIPSDYDSYLKYAEEGSRILALATKKITSKKFNFNNIKRNEIETELTFVGFILFESKLKEASQEVIYHLKEANVSVKMITGDNILTAVNVAKNLNFYNGHIMEGDEINHYIDMAESKNETINEIDENNNSKNYEFKTEIEKFTDLESTEQLDKIDQNNKQKIEQLSAQDAKKALLKTSIFARADPKHKEKLISFFKKANKITLMCGDGTNDVGALNEADVGIALLENKEKKINKRPESFAEALKNEIIDSKVNLGDACVAAPFTIRNGCLKGVLNVIRQGRSTLVTTFQMYKILALNSLITAYSLSFLDSCGVRFNDVQVTVSGILLAFAFMFLTKCEPLEKISEEKPILNIFNFYFLSSILLQTLVHLISTASLVFHVGMPEKYVEKFVPSLLNSSLYILSTTQQINTFVINYIGRPFRENLIENKPLCNCLLLCTGFILLVLSEQYMELNEYIEIVRMNNFKYYVLLLVILDCLGCYIVELICKKLFLKGNKNKITSKIDEKELTEKRKIA